jgi:hypothetical protein
MMPIAERPQYGKRRKPLFPPRIKARRRIARALPIGKVNFAVRAATLRRLFNIR